MMNIELVEIKHLIRTEDMDIWNYKNELTTLIDAEISRQTVKSEEVQEAIEELMHGSWQSYKDGYPITLGGKTIDLAITALQEYQPWVKVSERLPADCQLVLITRDGEMEIATYDGGCHNFNTDVFMVHEDNITHWKPLPEPPKGE